MRIKRGEVWLADLNPTRGSEQAGTRPVLVFQNDVVSKFTATVLAIRTNSDPEGVYACYSVLCALPPLLAATSRRRLDRIRARCGRDQTLRTRADPPAQRGASQNCLDLPHRRFVSAQGRRPAFVPADHAHLRRRHALCDIGLWTRDRARPRHGQAAVVF